MTGVEKQLTELLHSAAPASGGVSVEDVARRVRHRRSVRWSVVGSAATVAAVSVAVSLIGASGGGQSSRLATGPSVDLAGAVPWIDASAQPYRPPTVSPPAPPATDARPCTADEASAVWFSVMVSISDGDVAALARAAVDRIDTDLEVRIEPADPVDPYRWEFAAWMVYAGLASSYVVASMTEDEVLEKLTRDLAP